MTARARPRRDADGTQHQEPRPSALWLTYSYLPDWLCTIALLLIISLSTRNSGYQRQFSLVDTSIQHTYAVQERVPFWAALLAAGVAPAAIIVCIGFFWRKSFWDVHNGLLGLLSALGLTTVLTELIKISVGRPRPDFISRCQPLPGSVDMLYGLSNITACSVSEGHIIADGFKSFPSGHASFAFAGLGFLSIYLAGKLRLFDRRGFIIKAWIVFVPLIGAAGVSISRTMDYRHHASDVVVGGLLGFLVALLTYHLYYPPLHSAYSHLPYSPRHRHTELITFLHLPPSPGAGEEEFYPPPNELDPGSLAFPGEVEMSVPEGTVPRPEDNREGQPRGYRPVGVEDVV